MVKRKERKRHSVPNENLAKKRTGWQKKEKEDREKNESLAVRQRHFLTTYDEKEN